MALHGAREFSVFTLGASDGLYPLAGLALLEGLFAVATFWFAARDADGD